ncbi:PREDICTED: putative nuclease HARBI1 [Wasmannia auropunctata]|uniref:putative nuclease HARBI1 n=1 Tax=Wasmannia auropunctata TaxID=64793 RepID=UPI0005ED4790|nr:PREDICTED: putative nuclease HARBI1 [Wasmannia auropunctata]
MNIIEVDPVIEAILAFEWLYNTIAPELHSARISGCQTIEPKKQLLAILWLLATPDSYRSVGNRFDMGKSSVFVTFVRVIRVINRLAPRLITWPFGDRAVQNEDKFYHMAHIKGVVGAIDGTYVPIKAPMENPEVYINRKCFYGLTLQCICDSSRIFTNCFTGYPSSVSDVRIFRNSDIYAEFLEHPNKYFEGNKFIIGDKAYPVHTWCVPPYIDRVWPNGKLISTQHIQKRDKVPPHNSRIVQQTLNDRFFHKWIGHGGPRNWPARSPDLNPMDFFLWGHLKQYVYQEPIDDLEELEDKIIEAIATITPNMIISATTNLLRRAQLCIECDGGHFEQFL